MGGKELVRLPVREGAVGDHRHQRRAAVGLAGRARPGRGHRPAQLGPVEHDRPRRGREGPQEGHRITEGVDQ